MCARALSPEPCDKATAVDSKTDSFLLPPHPQPLGAGVGGGEIVPPDRSAVLTHRKKGRDYGPAWKAQAARAIDLGLVGERLENGNHHHFHLRPTGLQATHKGSKRKSLQNPRKPKASTEREGLTSEPTLHLILSPQLPQNRRLHIPGTERPSEST